MSISLVGSIQVPSEFLGWLAAKLNCVAQNSEPPAQLGVYSCVVMKKSVERTIVTAQNLATQRHCPCIGGAILDHGSYEVAATHE
jgi:hypothetical protein